MKLSKDLTNHQLRIILTRTVHNIDTVTQYDSAIISELIKACNILEGILTNEKEIVSSLIVKELIDVDIETLKENVVVFKSALKINSYEFEYELCMN